MKIDFEALTHFTLTEQVLLATLGAFFLYQCYFYIRYMSSVLRMAPSASDECPGVSVIICAKNEATNLRDYLHAVLSQDYPNFEVIVINDGSVDDTEIILKQYQKNCKDKLKISFVPPEARFRSTKKMGITLGIKASRFDYILLTDADCRPYSNQWIRNMMAQFKQGTDVVLGYGASFLPAGVVATGFEYETLTMAMQYLGMARHGKTYMGVGRNLAYRKEAFHRVNGFQKFLNIPSGDDDLLVQMMANEKNVSVCFDLDGTTWTPPKYTWHDWVKQKRRHLSVSSHYPFWAKIILVFEPLSKILFLAACVATFFLTSNYLLWGLAVLLFLVRWAMQSGIINACSRRMNGSHFGLNVLWWDIFLPFYRLFILLTNGRYERRAASW